MSYNKSLGYALRQRSKQLYLDYDDISIADVRISKRQANELARKITDKYNEYLNSPYSDKHQNRKNDYIYVEEDGKGRSAVHVHGHQVIYDEFGTGERGEANPHPEKHKYGLNPYNSGKFVSQHVTKAGLHYWYWDKSIHYGEESGKFVYRATMELADEKLNIAREEIQEIHKVLKRRMGHRSYTFKNYNKKWKGRW